MMLVDTTKVDERENRKSQKVCEKCGLDMSFSLWKDKPVIIQPFTKANTSYCVSCGLNSTYRRIMITESNLDKFIKKGKPSLTILQSPEFIEAEFERRSNIIKNRFSKKHQPLLKNRVQVFN
jgi:hypothetical protein